MSHWGGRHRRRRARHRHRHRSRSVSEWSYSLYDGRRSTDSYDDDDDAADTYDENDKMKMPTLNAMIESSCDMYDRCVRSLSSAIKIRSETTKTTLKGVRRRRRSSLASLILIAATAALVSLLSSMTIFVVQSYASSVGLSPSLGLLQTASSDSASSFSCGKMYYRTFHMDQARNVLYVGAV